MKKVLIINGPNLNLLGRRQPEIYGSETMDSTLDKLSKLCQVEYFQSNHEGEIIDRLHAVGFDHSYAGVVLNAGAYTHTSLAIADAIAAIEIPVVEVHISNIAARDEVRHHSMIAPVCCGSIAGFGLDSYRLGVEALING
jgi:3-dehydroquinate dehydratase-2